MVWQPEIEGLRHRPELAEGMGGPEGIARQRKRGKLTIRERLDLLIDPGSFREMGKLAGRAEYDESGNLTTFIPAPSVRGVAKVNGRRVYLTGSDFTIRGSSMRTDDGGVLQ